MDTSESVGVDYINLVCVAFTYDVDTSDALIRSLCYCCISSTSSFVKSTIVNGDRPLAAFTKSDLFPISDAVQSIFTLVFTKVGYIGTSASSKMQHLFIYVATTCDLSFLY